MKNVAKAKLLVTRFPYESRLGGEEMHTISLVQGLDKKGYEAFFLGSDPVLLSLFKKNGFLVKRGWLGKPPVTKLWLGIFTLLSPMLFLLAGFQLWNARKHWHVDTIYMHSLGEKLLMTPWAIWFGMKVLWVEHARFGNWMAKNPWRLLYSFLSKWTKTVVTSNAMKPLAEEFAKNVEAVPCGVILDKALPLREDIAKFLGGGFAVGTVARLTVDKGVDMIVRLVHSKPDVRLIIVGDGPLKNEVERWANPKQVILLPSMPRHELMSLYKALDLFVLGSTKMDPFGMVAAEAMWFGTPVLITDQCGIAADMQDGKEAFIVPAKFAYMDRALKKVMKHKELLKEVGTRGQVFVRENYKFNKMLDKMVGLL